MKKELLEFVKENVSKIVEKMENVDRIEDIKIDSMGDVGGVVVYIDEYEEGEFDEYEGGISFRWSEDVDDEFVGEEFSGGVREININGINLSYIEYNI